MKVLLIFPPCNYFELLQTDISEQLVLKNKIPDLIHAFAKDNTTFKEAMKTILKKCSLNPSGIIWVSWYKKNPVWQRILQKIPSGNLQ